MPGVQHLIDFVLNEVALCGNQGVYSFFTKTHFFLTPETHVISHVDFECHRNYVERLLVWGICWIPIILPLSHPSHDVFESAFSWCGPNVDLYPLSQALIGRFYSYTHFVEQNANRYQGATLSDLLQAIDDFHAQTPEINQNIDHRFKSKILVLAHD
jgi:hypothetical protein